MSTMRSVAGRPGAWIGRFSAEGAIPTGIVPPHAHHAIRNVLGLRQSLAHVSGDVADLLRGQQAAEGRHLPPPLGDRLHDERGVADRAQAGRAIVPALALRPVARAAGAVVGRLADIKVRLARGTMVDAIQWAVYFGNASPTTVQDVARAARSLTLPRDAEATSGDLVLDALADLYAEGYDYDNTIPALQRALAAIRNDAAVREVPRTLSLGCWAAFAKLMVLPATAVTADSSPAPFGARR